MPRTQPPSTRFILTMLSFLALPLALAAAGSPADPERFEFTRLLMGVQARIVIYAPDEESARSAATAAFDRIAALEEVMSDYQSQSELSRLPELAAAGPVRVSDDLYRVLERSQEFAAATDGAFDVTMGPLTKLWREMRRTGRPPTDEQRTKALARTGWQKLVLDPETRTVTLAPGMSLDLGGIGKGYAAQEAVNLLRERGIDHCLVALAGDIVAGNAPPGSPRGWRIEVDLDLQGESGSGFDDVYIANSAISTSSGRQQFIEVGSSRFSHIIDPRTGHGSTRNIGITAQAADGATADALGTALCLVDARTAAHLLAMFPDASIRIVRYTGDEAEEIGIADLDTPPTAHNTLTEEERAAGWELLFDGESLAKWRGFKKDDVPEGWQIVDGCMTRAAQAGDLITRDKFENFELAIDWAISPGGNSGIFYGVREEGYNSVWETGPEYQILDHKGYKGNLSPTMIAGADYALHAPSKDVARPAGEFNRTRIVVRGDHIEHWLNGVKIIEFERNSDDWNKRVAASKFADMPGYAKFTRGHLALQDHGDRVQFRNIKIRRLD